MDKKYRSEISGPKGRPTKPAIKPKVKPAPMPTGKPKPFTKPRFPGSNKKSK